MKRSCWARAADKSLLLDRILRGQTKKGSERVPHPATVTCRSCIASNSAAWVFGGVRLISSARITLLNSGPSRKRKSRPPVVRFSSITSVPVMSAGIRSGVNWMRLNVRFSARLSVLIIKVLASPGTPSSRQCPRLNSEISHSSITALARRLPAELVTIFSGPPSFSIAPLLLKLCCWSLMWFSLVDLSLVNRQGALGSWRMVRLTAVVKDRADVALVHEPSPLPPRPAAEDLIAYASRSCPSRYKTWA